MLSLPLHKMRNARYFLSLIHIFNDDKTELLEEEIDRLTGLFHMPKESSLPGACRLSAEIDVTWAVARRAERDLAAVSVKFGSDTGSKKYMNRLADYLYVLARYEDCLLYTSRCV